MAKTDLGTCVKATRPVGRAEIGNLDAARAAGELSRIEEVGDLPD
jgi:hypothetical protein